MDPVTLVVAAAVASASAGARDTARKAVEDAYGNLKALLEGQFGQRPAAQAALSKVEADSASQGHGSDGGPYCPALQAEVAQAVLDGQLVAAARRVLELADPAGAAAGKYTVTVHGSQGVQLGEGDTQTNTWITSSGAVPPSGH